MNDQAKIDKNKFEMSKNDEQVEKPISDGSVQKETIVVHVPRVTPRTLPGLANGHNKGAIDWGGHGLLAYGSNYTVVVVDTKNIQLVQCLDKHKAMIKKVLWGRDYLKQDRTASCTPRLYGSIDLVSSDVTGHIIVWDVTSGRQLNVLQDGPRAVADMHWVSQWDGFDHVLAALHLPCSLVLWDSRTGAKLWKKNYAENPIAFAFDPFHPSKMAFHCTDCILFVEDFNVSKSPTANGRKFYVSSPRSPSMGAKGSAGNLAGIVQEEKPGRLRRLVKDFVIGEVKPKTDESIILSECLQVTFLRSLKYHILLLYPREILILDLHIKQTVGIVPTVEKASSPYLEVFACKQRDVLYCLHETGSVSIKIKRKVEVACSPIGASVGSVSSFENSSAEAQLDLLYDHKCSSEPVRQLRGLQILGMAVNPVCETRVALYLNSGKIIFMELMATDSVYSNFHPDSNSDSCFSSSDKDFFHGFSLNEILPPLINEISIPSPGLRFLVTGLLPSVAAPITALKMCPAITTRNWQQYSPLLAGGTNGGVVQIYNVASACINKEFILHSYPVRGIEWVDLTTFFSYAHSHTSSANMQVKNELNLTDILTGETVPLRTDKGEEPPIEILRASPLKQYFILVMAGGAVELWDLMSRQLIRTMPKKFPVVTTLEWSPQSNSRSLRRRRTSKEECVLDVKRNELKGGGATITPVTPLTPSSSDGKFFSYKKDCAHKTLTKECFMFTDTDNQLYRFTVDGHSVDGVRIHPENGGGTVTAIAFKADHLVQGDADGLLIVWNMRSGHTRKHSTSRGSIKKIRFAPGKGNMKLLILYQDGVDVIDFKGSDVEKIGQLKCPRDMVKVLDFDWAASDKPVLATQDGCLRIMDATLVNSSSPVVDYEFKDPVFCPALLPSEVAYKVRERLSWQPPDNPYTTNLTTDHGFTDNQLALIKEQLSMVEEEQLRYLAEAPYKTAERCLMVARLFGDEKEIDLWTVALYYLKNTKIKIGAIGDSSEDCFASPDAPFHCKKICFHAKILPLDTCYDILQDSSTYQRLQLERMTLHENRRTEYEHTKRVIRQQLLLGQSDRAVQLLLETDVNHSEYYADALKACLVATVQSVGASQSTIKLVATNLIAHGSIWEGVQLLCLIGKGLDACRYLASHSKWGAAVWLARAVLPFDEAAEMIKKWADLLSSQGFKEKAVLVLISLEQWQEAHSLLSLVDPRRASLLAQACEEFGIDILSRKVAGNEK